MRLLLRRFDPVPDFLNAILLIKARLRLHRRRVHIRPDPRNLPITVPLAADRVDRRGEDQHVLEFLRFGPGGEFVLELEAAVFGRAAAEDEEDQLFFFVLEDFAGHCEGPRGLAWRGEAVVGDAGAEVFGDVVAELFHVGVVEDHEVAGDETCEAGAVGRDYENVVCKCGRSVSTRDRLKCHSIFG